MKPAKIITVAAQRGGAGKTTTAAALAQALKASKPRSKVLLVDMDGQQSASLVYDIMGGDGRPTTYEVIRGEAKASEAIRETEAGEIIPASSNIDNLQIELANQAGRDSYLREALEEIRESYNYIIIDTPPGVGTCLIQALTAADGVILPVLCEPVSYKGLLSITETISQVKKYCNASLEILGVLITLYQPQTILTRQYEELIGERCEKIGTKLLATKIRKAVAIPEAQALGKDLYKYAPKSKPALDYLALVKELKL